MYGHEKGVYVQEVECIYTRNEYINEAGIYKHRGEFIHMRRNMYIIERRVYVHEETGTHGGTIYLKEFKLTRHKDQLLIDPHCV